MYSLIVFVTGSQYTDTDLTNGTTYYYVVRALDTSSNESDPSNEASATPTTQVVATTMHVADLDAASTSQGRTWTATVAATIHDNLDRPVAGATVVGSWSGGVTGSVSGTTDANGVLTVSKSNLPKSVGVVTFTVTDVTGSLTYSAADNHDPDGDSNGTSIVVNKPLHVAQESLTGQLVGDLLTPAMVNSVTDAAITYWAEAGVASDRLDMLREVDVEIVDLDGSLLGLAYSNWITLDDDAAGYGWMAGVHTGSSHHSDAVNLFSAVAHEFGHLLGFEHSERQDDLMASTLLVDARPWAEVTGRVTHDIARTAWDSSLLLPLTRFAVLDRELPDQLTGVGSAQDIAMTDIDGLRLPLSAADYIDIDHPRSSSKAIDIRVLRDINDDETELLDDDLLAMLAASRS